MKRFLRKVSPFGVWGFYTAGVLCMSVSCKKEQPNLDCDNGTCCSSVKGVRFKFIQYVENAPANFWSGGGGGFHFDPSFHIPSPVLCELQSADLLNLKPNLGINTHLPPYKYRVWGRIYQALDARVIIDIPIYYINVEKVEEVN